MTQFALETVSASAYSAEACLAHDENLVKDSSENADALGRCLIEWREASRLL